MLSRKRWVSLVGAVLLLAIIAAPMRSASARGRLGMILDNTSESAVVFDQGTNAVIGSVPIGPSGGFIGDCSILNLSGDLFGFATNFDSVLRVIELDDSPALASGVNSIPISNPGEDTSFNPGATTLAVADGSAIAPISIVNANSRTERATTGSGHDFMAVETLADGALLSGSIIDGTAIHLKNGVETTFPMADPNNITAGRTPETQGAGIATSFIPPEITSFLIPSMTPVHTRALPGDTGYGTVLNAAATVAFVRDEDNVTAWTFNNSTGALGATPFWTTPVAEPNNSAFGADQLDLSADGTKLFVSEPGSVVILDPASGAPLGSITDTDIVDPTGICTYKP